MTETKATPAERRSELHRESELSRRNTRTALLTLWFGVVGPAACFWMETTMELDVFGRFETPLHVAAVCGVAVLLLHVSRRVTSPRALAVMSGFLGLSGVLAASAGLLLLPLSVITAFFVIGLLGFVPFGTAWVLFRAAREAWGDAAALSPRRRLALGACGAALAAFFPMGQPVAQELAYAVAFGRVDLATSGALQHANDALDWVPCLSVEPLQAEASSEEDEARFERLSQLCQLRFGFPIEEEIWAD